MKHVRHYKAVGKELPKTPVDEVIHTMIHELNRKGKAAGAGFYDYPENGKSTYGKA